MSNIDQPTKQLIGNLEKQGIPYELVEHEGALRVKQSPAIIEFLRSKEALHDPENPVYVTEQELLAKQAPDIEGEDTEREPIGKQDPMEQWRSIPSKYRATLRKQLGVPRLHHKTGLFCSKKQARRGTPGAFGGSSAKAKRDALLAEGQLRNFRLRVITEGDENPDRAIVVRAANLAQAKGAALLKHRKAYPDVHIEDIVEHTKQTA